MITLMISTLVSAALALFMPLRWGVWGFFAAVVLVFVLQAGINTAMGFEGTSWEESLLLFNGSIVSYIGFNLQITYRAFMLPLLVLSAILIWRHHRAGRG